MPSRIDVKSLRSFGVIRDLFSTQGESVGSQDKYEEEGQWCDSVKKVKIDEMMCAVKIKDF